MSYSDNFPSQRASLLMDFANGGRIDPRATFSRASTGTFFGTDKVLSSENLLLQSENFTTTWAVQDASGAAGATAPDGGTDGYTITSNSGSSKGPRASQSLSGKLSTSTEYTMVGHVKSGTATHAYISFRGNNSNNYAYAQLQFSSPGSVSTGGAGFTGISGTVTALGSSWYRLTLTATTGSNVSGAFAFIGVNDGTAFGISGYPVWTSAGETLEVWGAQLSTTQAKVYDSPTTTQIARSYQTKLQTAASGAARFEHSAIDGQPEGILIESQSTNLLTNSTDFSGSWQVLNATKSLEAIAPNGALNAIAFREGTNSNEKRLLRYYTAGGGNVTISVYAKLMGNTRRLVIREANASGQSAIFDISTGTKVSGNGSIDSVGSGWYRCQLNLSSTNTVQAAAFYLIPADGTSYSASTYAGDGYSGLLLAMPQAEDQSFASSYIDTGTGGSTATRAAESLSVGLSDINQNPIGNAVSAVAEFDTNANDAQFRRVMVLKDGTTGLRIDPQVYAGTGYVYVANTSGGTTELTNKSGVGTGFHKVAIGLDSTTANASFDGATAATMSNADTASVQFDTLQIGSYSATQLHLEGHIRNLSLYNVGLSATNVEAITS
jgi:hypothetical protein